MLITKRLRDLRESHKLSQQTLCSIVNVTQQQYSKYENGKSKTPPHVLERLANYYNISIDYIIGRTACKQDIGVLNKEVVDNITVGALISEILTLSKEGRMRILEQISFWQMREDSKE